MAVYFTSEAAAREGERKQPPELQAQMDELAALSVREPEFFDLNQPWLHSAWVSVGDVMYKGPSV